MTMQDMIKEHQEISAQIAAEPQPWLSYRATDLCAVEGRMKERATELLAEQVNMRPGQFSPYSVIGFHAEITAFLLFQELNRS